MMYSNNKNSTISLQSSMFNNQNQNNPTIDDDLIPKVSVKFRFSWLIYINSYICTFISSVSV